MTASREEPSPLPTGAIARARYEAPTPGAAAASSISASNSPEVRSDRAGASTAGDLAAVIGVNKNTVLRALRALRDEGLLEFRRGRGISVAGTSSQSEVLARTKELVEFARERGYRRDELAQIIDRMA